MGVPKSEDRPEDSLANCATLEPESVVNARNCRRISREKRAERLLTFPGCSGLIEYIAVCVVAVVLHELAHAIVARALGIRIKRVGINWRGPYLIREQGPPLACFITALAGPAMNLLLAAAFWTIAPQFGLVNLVLGGYNLLPFVRGLDGYNALNAYRRLAAPAPSSLS